MKGADYINVPELLVMMVQNIKEDPFEKLMKVCEPITHSVVSRYFLPQHERADLLQEARSVLVEAANTFNINEGMAFLHYYHMSLCNHFNMLLRKEHAQKRKINKDTTSLDELTEMAGIQVKGASSNDTCPEDVAVVKETYNNYLIDLSPFERRVFSLLLKGKTQEEMAEELESTVKIVRSAIYRCSKKLKTAVYK